MQDDLRLDQECYPETEVESFMLKALVSDQLLWLQLWSLTRLHSRRRPALLYDHFFPIPEVVAYESSSCYIKKNVSLIRKAFGSEVVRTETRKLFIEDYSKTVLF